MSHVLEHLGCDAELPFALREIHRLSWDIMQDYLRRAGFRTARRVADFGFFDDASRVRFAGELISLSAEAWK
jgi:hypothetical protein